MIYDFDPYSSDGIMVHYGEFIKNLQWQSAVGLAQISKSLQDITFIELLLEMPYKCGCVP